MRELFHECFTITTHLTQRLRSAPTVDAVELDALRTMVRRLTAAQEALRARVIPLMAGAAHTLI